MDYPNHDSGQFGIVDDASEALQMMRMTGLSEGRGSTRVGNSSTEVTPLRMTSRQVSWKSTPSVHSDKGHSLLGGNGLTGVFNDPLESPSQAETALYVDQVGSTESNLLYMRSANLIAPRSSTRSNYTHAFGHLEIPPVGTTKSERTNLLARPHTADSTDIEKQASTAFEGFDGVHFVDGEGRELCERPDDESSLLEALSLHEDDQPTDQGMAKDNMVYYPAPVPMMLNMPQRLSKLPPASFREDRHSQVMDTMRSTVKGHTSWHPHTFGKESSKQAADESERSPRRKSLDPRRSMVNLASLPPQLRASVFFEQAPISHEVEIKEQSATATLESILDASEHAPVCAFTDHPFARHIGQELYGATTGRGNSRGGAASVTHKSGSLASLSVLNSKQSSTHSAPKGPRSSSTSAFPQIELSANQGNLSEPRTIEELKDRAYPVSGLSDIEPGYVGENGLPELCGEADPEAGSRSNERLHFGGSDRFAQPTTLMAELQLRKQQQRDRNMTAATAFPNGMHYSTLLELDTVAEVQKLSRKNKRIALAWEEPHMINGMSGEVENEDLPLAMLFPSLKSPTLDCNRPLGLLEKRDLEDSEPLSCRRERLKSGLQRPRISRHTTAMGSAYQPDLVGGSGKVEAEVEADEETLAQRARRLKAGVERLPDGAGQLLTSHPLNDLPSQVEADDHPEEEGEIEETLAQRKKRLQLERRPQSHGENGKTQNHSGEGQVLEQRRSMARTPSEHPDAFNLQQPQSESSPPLNTLFQRSQHNLQANNNHPQLARNSTFTEFPYSRNSWVPNSSSGVPSKNTIMNNLAFSRSAHDFSSPGSNKAGASRRTTTMSILPGAALGGAGPTSVLSGVAPSPASASLGAQQREMINRWRLSVLP